MWISECFPADENLDPEFIAEHDLPPGWTLTVECHDDGSVSVRGEESLGPDESDAFRIGDHRLLRGDSPALQWAARWLAVMGHRRNLAGYTIEWAASGPTDMGTYRMMAWTGAILWTAHSPLDAIRELRRFCRNAFGLMEAKDLVVAARENGQVPVDL